MSLDQTNFSFSNLNSYYRGKVRDVYFFKKEMAVVATDRISAFDVILPKMIPYKGQVLNLIAAHFLEESRDIISNWLISVPHPNVSIGLICEPIRLEMVVRAYLAGHAWRIYQSGGRTICGVTMPDGLKEGDAFPQVIITPATKAEEGHDEDISSEEILKQKIVSNEVWDELCNASLALFRKGSDMAKKRGLILVDTKYEFGIYNRELMLIDEIHTPDSSRYYVLDGYQERQDNGVKQEQLSKEFVREWLIENGFQGKEGDVMPVMDDKFVQVISDRYINLYEKIVGKPFCRESNKNELRNIKNCIEDHFQ